jgi:hypothetical protein
MNLRPQMRYRRSGAGALRAAERGGDDDRAGSGTAGPGRLRTRMRINRRASDLLSNSRASLVVARRRARRCRSRTDHRLEVDRGLSRQARVTRSFPDCAHHSTLLTHGTTPSTHDCSPGRCVCQGESWVLPRRRRWSRCSADDQYRSRLPVSSVRGPCAPARRRPRVRRSQRLTVRYRWYGLGSAYVYVYGESRWEQRPSNHAIRRPGG